MSEPTEHELQTELGRIERTIIKLQRRKEEILRELEPGPASVGRPSAEILADRTGQPVEKFESDAEHPDLDSLETRSSRTETEHANE